ncbi:MAG: hypothetical protein ACFFD4_19370 [Candidatus Odinarchaeota archaeon]
MRQTMNHLKLLGIILLVFSLILGILIVGNLYSYITVYDAHKIYDKKGKGSSASEIFSVESEHVYEIRIYLSGSLSDYLLSDIYASHVSASVEIYFENVLTETLSLYDEAKSSDDTSYSDVETLYMEPVQNGEVNISLKDIVAAKWQIKVWRDIPYGTVQWNLIIVVGGAFTFLFITSAGVVAYSEGKKKDKKQEKFL